MAAPLPEQESNGFRITAKHENDDVQHAVTRRLHADRHDRDDHRDVHCHGDGRALARQPFGRDEARSRAARRRGRAEYGPDDRSQLESSDSHAVQLPGDGSGTRRVELIGTPTKNDANDNATDRCSETKWRFPANDTDPTSRPNHDGPIRKLPSNGLIRHDFHARILAQRYGALHRHHAGARDGNGDHGDAGRIGQNHHGERRWKNSTHSNGEAASRSSKCWSRPA